MCIRDRRYSVPYGNLKNKKIMRLLQSKRRLAIAPQWSFILKNKAAIGTLSNKSIRKLTLPIGSEGGVTLGILIGVCCRILQIASLFHMSCLTPVFRPSFLKSIRLMQGPKLRLPGRQCDQKFSSGDQNFIAGRQLATCKAGCYCSCLLYTSDAADE